MYSCNYMIFWKRQNYEDDKKFNGYQGLRLREWIGKAQRIFRAMKILWKYKWWKHIIIHLSRPLQCTAPRLNPNVNYGFCMIITCQCRFLDCNQCTSLVGNVDDGGGYACVRGQGVYAKSVPSFCFCCDPKTALKVFKKKTHIPQISISNFFCNLLIFSVLKG